MKFKATSSSKPVDSVSPVSSGVQISDVNKSLWQYIKKRKLWQLIVLLPLALIWEAFVIVLFVKYLAGSSGTNSQGGQGFGYLLTAPILVFSTWLYRLRKQFEEAFLEEFAKANNYSFEKNAVVDQMYGSIFRLHGRQSISDIVTGDYDKNPLRLFLYELVVGSGRYQQRYQDTVVELDLHGMLPNLLMVNKHSRFGQLNLTGAFGVSNTIKLEGDFNDYFTLYAPQGNEIEALEVFTPDTMALMEDESKHYTVEFAGNRIYIYCNGFIGKTENITQLFMLAKKLIDKIDPLSSRFSRDSAIVEAPVNISEPRQSHPFARVFGVVLSVILLLAGLTITIILAYTNPENSNRSNATSTAQTSTSTTSQGVSGAPLTPSVNPTAFPYCGAIPDPTLHGPSQQYLTATITLNKARQQISTAISSSANNDASNEVINEQIAADKAFLNSLQTIPFSGTAHADSESLIAAIQKYDNLIAQEENSTVSNTTLNNARTARSSASNQLRSSLGLPSSTCSFYEP